MTAKTSRRCTVLSSMAGYRRRRMGRSQNGPDCSGSGGPESGPLAA